MFYMNRIKQKPLPTIPINESDDDIIVNNNSENGNGIRNAERPLPPLPRPNDDPQDRIDESPDESEIEEDDDSDVLESSDDREDNEDLTNEQSMKLLNGTSTNGTNEFEENFNADATLPPSPTKTSTTSLTEISNSHSSHELPSSPENERFLKINFSSKCHQTNQCKCFFLFFPIEFTVESQRMLSYGDESDRNVRQIWRKR